MLFKNVCWQQFSLKKYDGNNALLKCIIANKKPKDQKTMGKVWSYEQS